jgi:hypothetical protein
MEKQYRGKKALQTNQVFQEANKTLGLGYMAQHWKKSRRQIYSWSADPDHCEVHYVNPLEKIKLMLMEMQVKGEEEIIESALQLLAIPLGYKVSPIKTPPHVSKEKSEDNLFKRLFFKLSEILKLFSNHFDKKELNDKEKYEIHIVIENFKEDLTELQLLLNK